MAKYSATHTVVCPFTYQRDRGLAITVCGKRFTGRATSEHSQEDADNKAEAECYRKFNGHVNRAHNR